MTTDERMAAIQKINAKMDALNLRSEVIHSLQLADSVTISCHNSKGLNSIAVSGKLLSRVFEVMLLEETAQKNELIEEANKLIKS